MIRVKAVAPEEGFKVTLTFTDGSRKCIDLEPFLHGPIFEPLRSHRDKFLEVRVDPDLGTIVWPNGADIDPDVLYHGHSPASQDHAPSK